ncbi:MAG: DUF3303 family protein [Terracidiphilus sp.]
MRFMTTWSVRPGTTKEAVARFLAGQGTPPPGVKMLGRWHKADLSGGFTLTESDNPTAVYESAAVWIDVLEIHGSVVVEDAEAGPILAKVFK